MLESPISSLYQAVRQVFAPMLLKVRKVAVIFFLTEVFGEMFSYKHKYLFLLLMLLVFQF